MRDRAEIVALPPLIFLAGLVVGFGVEFLVPTSLGRHAAWLVVGVAAIVAGAVLGLAGERAMRRAGTSPYPWHPTMRIVESGPYAWTRNPLYLAQATMYTGISIAGDSLWAVALLIPVLAVVRFGVIAPEERYLTAKFGEVYLGYARRVHRWFGRRA